MLWLSVVFPLSLVIPSLCSVAIVSDDRLQQQQRDEKEGSPSAEMVEVRNATPGKRLQEATMMTCNWTQIGDDINGDAANDKLGTSVSLSADGKTLAVGNPFVDGNGSFSGHVRVYRVNAQADWVQLGEDIDGEAANDWSGSSVSLSANGSTLAIGAPFNTGSNGGTRTGHVRVFNFDSNGWRQLGEDIDGEAQWNFFGSSVSLSADGTTLAVGAVRNGGNGIDSGHVRVFEFDAATASWIQLGNDIDGEAVANGFGFSVSLSADGGTLAAGARRGNVRVFKQSEEVAGWTTIGSINAGSRSFVSLSADGTTLAVSAIVFDQYRSYGSTRVFNFGLDGWTEIGELERRALGEEEEQDYLGNLVSLSADGTIVSVGVPYSNSGYVRVYGFEPDTGWSQIGSDLVGEAAGDKFGTSISLSADGTRLAVGAYLNDGNGLDSGQVQVYDSAGRCSVEMPTSAPSAASLQPTTGAPSTTGPTSVGQLTTTSPSTSSSTVAPTSSSSAPATATAQPTSSAPSNTTASLPPTVAPTAAHSLTDAPTTSQQRNDEVPSAGAFMGVSVVNVAIAVVAWNIA
jgi:hypothetical protein